MNQNEISELVTLLSNAYRSQDWEQVMEAIEFSQEFLDSPILVEEE